MTGFTDKRRHLCSEKFNEPVYSQNVCFRICRWRTWVWLNLVKMVADLLTITQKLQSSHPNLTNFIQILFQVNLNRMWDIWSFFFQLCPTFSFCWDICRFSFWLCPVFGFLWEVPSPFFCICPAFGFLWEVSLPFLAYVLLWDFCGRFPRLFLHMSHLLIPPQNLYQMILICLSTYPVYKFPEQNTLIFLPFRII